MQPADSVTRFIFSKSDFSREKMLVKERALRPRDTESEVSVFRTTRQTPAEIWDVGKQYVLPERKLSNPEAKIHACANFNAVAATSQGLNFDAAEPPPNHFLMLGWPVEKHDRMQIAQEIASRSFLDLPITPLE